MSILHSVEACNYLTACNYAQLRPKHAAKK